MDDAIKVKIMKHKYVSTATVPSNFVRELNLRGGQKMAIYTAYDAQDVKKIYAVPLGEDQPDPTYECDIRKLNKMGKYSLDLTIPPKIMKEMKLVSGDFILARAGSENGVHFITFKPDRPDSETRVYHNDDETSTVQKTGRINTDSPDIGETLPAYLTEKETGVIKVKTARNKGRFEITIPAKIASELNLYAGQKMAIYARYDPQTAKKIYAVPILKHDPIPDNKCIVRVIRQESEHSLNLTIPLNMFNNMHLKLGDYLMTSVGKTHGVSYIVLKSNKPVNETLLQDNIDWASIVNKFNLKSDDSVDTDNPVAKETIPTEIVEQIIGVTKVKIMKNKQICEIIVPEKIVRELNLHQVQRMVMYWSYYESNAQKIRVIPLEKNESNPTCEGNIRIVTAADKSSMTLIIPTKIMKELNLEPGDYILIGVENTGVLLCVGLKPDRPIMETIQANNDGTTTVNTYRLKPDDSMDADSPVVRETVPTDTANEMIKKIETENTNPTPMTDRVDESGYIDTDKCYDLTGEIHDKIKPYNIDKDRMNLKESSDESSDKSNDELEDEHEKEFDINCTDIDDDNTCGCIDCSNYRKRKKTSNNTAVGKHCCGISDHNESGGNSYEDISEYNAKPVNDYTNRVNVNTDDSDKNNVTLTDTRYKKSWAECKICGILYDISVCACCMHNGIHGQKTEQCDTFNITVTVPKNRSVNITLTSDGLDNIKKGTKKQD